MGCSSSVEASRAPAAQGNAAAPPLEPLSPRTGGGADKEAAVSAPEPTSIPRPAKIKQGSQGALSLRNVTTHSSTGGEAENFSSGLVFTDVNTHLNSTTAAFNLIKKGDLEGLKKLVESAFDGNRRRVHVLRGMWDSTPLLVALQYQHRAIVDYLLEEPPSPALINSPNEKGATAVLFAALEGDSEVLERLLVLGAAVDLPPSRDAVYNPHADQSLVCTPLSSALLNNHKVVVSQLLNAGVPHSAPFAFPAMKSTLARAGGRGVEGLTPLLMACALAHDTILRDLLARGADVAARDGEGSTALHHLARAAAKLPAQRLEQVRECLAEVLASGGVSYDLLHARDCRGDTPLLAACEAKDLELPRRLLDEGASAADANALTGMSALHVAVKRKQPQLAALLLEFGADPIAKPAPPPPQPQTAATAPEGAPEGAGPAVGSVVAGVGERKAATPNALSPLELARKLLPEDSEIVRALLAASAAWASVRDTGAAGPTADAPTADAPTADAPTADESAPDHPDPSLSPLLQAALQSPRSPVGRDYVLNFSGLLDESLALTQTPEPDELALPRELRLEAFLAQRASFTQADEADGEDSAPGSPVQLVRRSDGTIAMPALAAADSDEVAAAVDSLAAVALQRAASQRAAPPEQTAQALEQLRGRQEARGALDLLQLLREEEEQREGAVLREMDLREEAAAAAALRRALSAPLPEDQDQEPGTSAEAGGGVQQDPATSAAGSPAPDLADPTAPAALAAELNEMDALEERGVATALQTWASSADAAGQELSGGSGRSLGGAGSGSGSGKAPQRPAGSGGTSFPRRQLRAAEGKDPPEGPSRLRPSAPAGSSSGRSRPPRPHAAGAGQAAPE